MTHKSASERTSLRPYPRPLSIIGPSVSPPGLYQTTRKIRADSVSTIRLIIKVSVEARTPGIPETLALVRLRPVHPPHFARNNSLYLPLRFGMPDLTPPVPAALALPWPYPGGSQPPRGQHTTARPPGPRACPGLAPPAVSGPPRARESSAGAKRPGHRPAATTPR